MMAFFNSLFFFYYFFLNGESQTDAKNSEDDNLLRVNQALTTRPD